MRGRGPIFFQARRTGRERFTAVSLGWLHATEVAVFPDRLVVRALGAVPLGSMRWENVAVQQMAEALGDVFYGSDFHVT